MYPNFEAILELNVERRNPKWRELGKEHIKETVVSEDDIFLWNFCTILKALLWGYRSEAFTAPTEITIKDEYGLVRTLPVQAAVPEPPIGTWAALTVLSHGTVDMGTRISVGKGAATQNYFDYLYEFKLVSEIERKSVGEPTLLAMDRKVDLILSATFTWAVDQVINEAGLYLTAAQTRGETPTAEYLLMKNSFVDISVLAGDVLTVSYRFRFNY